MVQAVIFDMDGTLIDTEKYYRICWPKSLADYGYDMTDAQALVMRSLGSPYGIAQLRDWFGEDFPFEENPPRRLSSRTFGFVASHEQIREPEGFPPPDFCHG